MSSRFARVRVGVGHNKLDPGSLQQEWLWIESPEREAEPTKYWLATLPANISLRRLVDLAKMRGASRDARISRPIQPIGIISSRSILGGLHHHYVRAQVLGTHNVAHFMRRL